MLCKMAVCMECQAVCFQAPGRQLAAFLSNGCPPHTQSTELLLGNWLSQTLKTPTLGSEIAMSFKLRRQIKTKAFYFHCVERVKQPGGGNAHL